MEKIKSYMKYFKNICLCGIFGIVLISAVSYVLVANANSEEVAGQDALQTEAAIYKRLLKIEKQVNQIRENQKQIEAKNLEIKNELANLKIWIYRR